MENLVADKECPKCADQQHHGQQIGILRGHVQQRGDADAKSQASGRSPQRLAAQKSDHTPGRA